MADKEDTPVEEIVDKPEETKPTEDAPPPVNTEKPNDDLRNLVDELSERINGLETAVQALAPTEQDTVPGNRKPWTHRGWGRR